MNKIEKILRAKRQAQIAKLEGREPERTDDELDAQLDQVTNESARLLRDKERENKKRRRKMARQKGLYITQHAWKRMGQRRMAVKHVYALWIYGDVRTSKNTSRTIHVCTRDAWRMMPKRERDLLRKFVGAAIIVQVQEPEAQAAGRLPAVVTVLADGEDTRFG